MNNWNFNEVTQQDLYDFKACKHDKTGEIYGEITCRKLIVNKGGTFSGKVKMLNAETN